MSTHLSPLSMSMSPVAFHLQPPAHAQTFTGSVRVTNSGSQAVIVHPQVIRLETTGKGTCTNRPPSWLHLESTISFRLAPHQTHAIAFQVSSTPTLTGDAAVMAYGQPASHGRISAWAGTGARVEVGSGQQQCTAPQTAPVSQSTGLNPVLLALICVAALGLALAVLRTRTHHHHRNGN